MSTQSISKPTSRHTKPKFQQPPPSPIEIAFWKAAKPMIAELEREVWIDKYRVDFFIPSRKVVIELYGHKWHSSQEKMAKDAERERYLQQLGYHVIHFMGREILKNPEECVIEVLKCIKGLTGSGLFSQPAPTPTVAPSPIASSPSLPATVRPAPRPAPRSASRLQLGMTARQWQVALMLGAFDLAVIALGLLVAGM